MSKSRGRRSFLALLGAAACRPPRRAAAVGAEPVDALEAELGGRVGLYAEDAAGRHLAHRADERFAMCSTFKWLLAAAVLAEVDAGRLQLDAELPYGDVDLLDYAPTTRAAVARGALPISTLCEAAVTLSDNTAANLLIDRLGGPSSVTAFARRVGDPVTRLDRDEPSLNDHAPGDPRDTTSPRAMAATLRRVMLSDVLSEPSRTRLTGWLEGCRTCAHRLRAQLPPGWRAADKTGTGPRGASGDVGLLWPPRGGAPIVVATYLSDSDASVARREDAHAALGRLIAERLGPR